jgi:hypothetical protein
MQFTDVLLLNTCSCHIFCDSSDVFSYPEDDSVEDPLLAQHLSHFGIDFSSLQKVSNYILVWFTI